MGARVVVHQNGRRYILVDRRGEPFRASDALYFAYQTTNEQTAQAVIEEDGSRRLYQFTKGQRRTAMPSPDSDEKIISATALQQLRAKLAQAIARGTAGPAHKEQKKAAVDECAHLHRVAKIREHANRPGLAECDWCAALVPASYLIMCDQCGVNEFAPPLQLCSDCRREAAAQQQIRHVWHGAPVCLDEFSDTHPTNFERVCPHCGVAFWRTEWAPGARCPCCDNGARLPDIARLFPLLGSRATELRLRGLAWNLKGLDVRDANQQLAHIRHEREWIDMEGRKWENVFTSAGRLHRKDPENYGWCRHHPSTLLILGTKNLKFAAPLATADAPCLLFLPSGQEPSGEIANPENPNWPAGSDDNDAANGADDRGDPWGEIAAQKAAKARDALFSYWARTGVLNRAILQAWNDFRRKIQADVAWTEEQRNGPAHVREQHVETEARRQVAEIVLQTNRQNQSVHAICARSVRAIIPAHAADNLLRLALPMRGKQDRRLGIAEAHANTLKRSDLFSVAAYPLLFPSDDQAANLGAWGRAGRRTQAQTWGRRNALRTTLWGCGVFYPHWDWPGMGALVQEYTLTMHLRREEDDLEFIRRKLHDKKRAAQGLAPICAGQKTYNGGCHQREFAAPNVIGSMRRKREQKATFSHYQFYYGAPHLWVTIVFEPSWPEAVDIPIHEQSVRAARIWRRRRDYVLKQIRDGKIFGPVVYVIAHDEIQLKGQFHLHAAVALVSPPATAEDWQQLITAEVLLPSVDVCEPVRPAASEKRGASLLTAQETAQARARDWMAKFVLHDCTRAPCGRDGKRCPFPHKLQPRPCVVDNGRHLEFRPRRLAGTWANGEGRPYVAKRLCADVNRHAVECNINLINAHQGHTCVRAILCPWASEYMLKPYLLKPAQDWAQVKYVTRKKFESEYAYCQKLNEQERGERLRCLNANSVTAEILFGDCFVAEGPGITRIRLRLAFGERIGKTQRSDVQDKWEERGVGGGKRYAGWPVDIALPYNLEILAYLCREHEPGLCFVEWLRRYEFHEARTTPRRLLLGRSAPAFASVAAVSVDGHEVLFYIYRRSGGALVEIADEVYPSDKHFLRTMLYSVPAKGLQSEGQSWLHGGSYRAAAKTWLPSSFDACADRVAADFFDELLGKFRDGRHNFPGRARRAAFCDCARELQGSAAGREQLVNIWRRHKSAFLEEGTRGTYSARRFANELRRAGFRWVELLDGLHNASGNETGTTDRGAHGNDDAAEVRRAAARRLERRKRSMPLNEAQQTALQPLEMAATLILEHRGDATGLRAAAAPVANAAGRLARAVRPCVIRGRRGTGKTAFGRYLRDYFASRGLRVVCSAPSGAAARLYGLDGVTIHHVLNMRPSRTELNEDGLAFADIVQQTEENDETLRAIDVIIVDELWSATRNWIETLSNELQRARGSDLPFGGVLFVGLGDPRQQLPVLDTRGPFGSQVPVGPAEIDRHSVNSVAILQKPTARHVELTTLERRNQDTTAEWVAFVEGLGETAQEIDLTRFEWATTDVVAAEAARDSTAQIVAATHRQCREWNKKATRAHQRQNPAAKSYVKTARGRCAYVPSGDIQETAVADSCPDVHLLLVEGMRVEFVRRYGQYVKHTQGIVDHVGTNYVCLRARVEGEDDTLGQLWNEEFVWVPRLPHVWTDSYGAEQRMLQFPLRAAYAKTFTSIQGVTVRGKLFWDTDQPLFTHGSGYVVCGRVESAAQLRTCGLSDERTSSVANIVWPEFLRMVNSEASGAKRL